MCFAPQRRALFRHLNFQKCSDHGVLCTFWLGNVLRATTACTFSSSQLPKPLRTPQFLTSKSASRHSAVHFFNISTSKSGPILRCFEPSKCASRHNGVHFFRTPSVLYSLTSKCASRHNGVHFFDISTSKSGPTMVCFCTFWLGNVLRATTACTFSTSQLPKVVRSWGVLYILTWKYASRHNGVHFSEPLVFCTVWLPNVLRATTACTFSTSQLPKVLRPWCVFVHFDLEMCFAPQRRALFRHLNFQKWSDPEAFYTFWLGNMLRATTACTFPNP